MYDFPFGRTLSFRTIAAISFVLILFFALAGIALGLAPVSGFLSRFGIGDRNMVLVPAGWFTMGSNLGAENERPERRVYLDAYEMDRFEITNGEYLQFVQATGRTAPPYWTSDGFPTGQFDRPVVGVSWSDADDYCRWAGERLATEAEWEKACRGEKGLIYPWGNEYCLGCANVGQPDSDADSESWDDAWRILRDPLSSSENQPWPVGSRPSGTSAYGICDLVGNASEWVADWYNWSDYSSLPDRNPYATGPPWNHVLRGSSWYDPYGRPGEEISSSRCSARNSSHASNDPRAGVRCARTVH